VGFRAASAHKGRELDDAASCGDDADSASDDLVHILVDAYGSDYGGAVPCSVGAVA
jgi:hypothetical protein